MKRLTKVSILKNVKSLGKNVEKKKSFVNYYDCSLSVDLILKPSLACLSSRSHSSSSTV